MTNQTQTTTSEPTPLPLARFQREVALHLGPEVYSNNTAIIRGFGHFLGDPRNPIDEEEFCQLSWVDGEDEDEAGLEVFEHWSISDRLASRLEDEGERVVRLDSLDLVIWCRTTSGQSLFIDTAMERIAAEDLNIRQA